MRIKAKTLLFINMALLLGLGGVFFFLQVPSFWSLFTLLSIQWAYTMFLLVQNSKYEKYSEELLFRIDAQSADKMNADKLNTDNENVGQKSVDQSNLAGIYSLTKKGKDRIVEYIEKTANYVLKNTTDSQQLELDLKSSHQETKTLMDDLAGKISFAVETTESVKSLSSEGREKLKQLEDIFNVTIQMASTSQKALDQVTVMLQEMREITLQAKLLSFNAAIESARAGVHGRAFSVVAEEITRFSESVNGITKKAENEMKSALEENQKNREQVLGNAELSQNLIGNTANQLNSNFESINEVLDCFEQIKTSFENYNNLAKEFGGMLDRISRNTNSIGVSAANVKLIGSMFREHCPPYSEVAEHQAEIQEDIHSGFQKSVSQNNETSENEPNNQEPLTEQAS